MDFKRRINKIESSLNVAGFATLEDLVAGNVTDKPLPPAIERFFSELETRSTKEGEVCA